MIMELTIIITLTSTYIAYKFYIKVNEYVNINIFGSKRKILELIKYFKSQFTTKPFQKRI